MWERRIAPQYNEWAKANNYVERTDKALKKKFNRLRTGPPTGNGEPSPIQKRAQQIYRRMLEVVEATNVGDPARDDHNEDDAASADVEEEMLNQMDGIEDRKTKKAGRQAYARLAASMESPDLEERPAKRPKNAMMAEQIRQGQELMTLLNKHLEFQSQLMQRLFDSPGTPQQNVTQVNPGV